MRQLMKLPFRFSFNGLRYGIPICCVLYFESVHLTCIRNEIPEYQEARIHDHKKGIIKCPECIELELAETDEVSIHELSRITGVSRTAIRNSIKDLMEITKVGN